MKGAWIMADTHSYAPMNWENECVKAPYKYMKPLDKISYPIKCIF